jgi:2-polyprenyl-3-methyl-5-hydroxy-6-metoxy-1,4-benzoquinol methylase
MSIPDPTLTDVRAHFSFGENWASYAHLIDEDAIAESVQGVIRLLGINDLSGRSFLDVGCGSGLHALAALRLGAAQVTALDIDPVAVTTTKAVLDRLASSQNWTVECRSVLEATPGNLGVYDIVYSWGVLHHTGALLEALFRAAAVVKVDGLFALALYRKTPLCPIWRMIKRWYSQTGRTGQAIARALYIALFRVSLLARGRSMRAYIRNYKSHRGMDFDHDVHDWLGGYPYESIAPEELRAFLAQRGLREVHSFRRPAAALGLFGSHCDEYLLTKSRV